jgi:hypothetical protein
LPKRGRTSLSLISKRRKNSCTKLRIENSDHLNW